MNERGKSGLIEKLPSCATDPVPTTDWIRLPDEQSGELVAFFDMYNTTVFGNTAEFAYLREPIDYLMELLGLKGKVARNDFLIRCLTIRHADPGLYLASVAQEFGVPVTNGLRDEFVRLVEADRDGLRVFSDVLDVLYALKLQGFRLGMITNSWPFPVKPILERTGLDRVLDPDLVVSSHEVGKAKQQGTGIYHEAVRRAGVPASKCMMIGDNPEDDILRARETGMFPVLIIRRREGDDLATCEAVCTHPAIAGTDVPIVRSLREVQLIAQDWAARLRAH
jgi:FMN phosphatase YigB (HAD superfamily)